MPPLVLVETLWSTILDTLACTFYFENLFLSAEFTFADVDTLIFQVLEGKTLICVISDFNDND
jgi:hypothetical protein